MNKFVFAALMTWTGLTAAAGLAPAQAPHGGASRSASPAWTAAATWTCAHNAYRSVFCQ
jgi:hypothetical protein